VILINRKAYNIRVHTKNAIAATPSDYKLDVPLQKPN